MDEYVVNKENLFIGNDTFKRFLCNLMDVTYTISNEELLELIKNKL